MATKKKEKDFQLNYSEYKKWDTDLKATRSTNYLLVVDVYATWCGSCKALVPTFQKVLMDKGGDENLLRFAVVR